jgi:DNA invertase Pin-like site-specific DNA recombinase
VAQRGWTIAAEHSDVASGRQDQRPGLAAAVEAVRRGEAEALLVVRLDRAARSVAHLAALAEQVPIVAADQQFDTTTAAGRLVFSMLAAVAAFEADLLRERTIDGLRVARARGKRLGRRPVLTGARLERARALRQAGASWREIAREVGASLGTVRRACA